ncbi:MAG TPA: hypothetical protein VGZ00_03210 [Candidatus Baltobacteraceae bacterium]|nr:hypothetical protein [Candidatus Baltobacteraceae bacterium]
MDRTQEQIASARGHEWIAWPVCWSALWVGALTSIAAVLVFGLVGTALGITSIEHVRDFSSWKSLTLIDTAAAIFGAFLAFVIGGWVTGKIAGIRRSEPAILHAAISWLLALPLLLVFLSLGAGEAFGGWYGSIIGHSPFGAAGSITPTPEAIRHGAIAAVTALLLGLIGAVIGGWMACGEPMSITHYRKRANLSAPRTEG